MRYKPPDKAERIAKDISLIDHYAQLVVWQYAISHTLSTYLAVDAYFAKVSFIDRITSQPDQHIISLLRQDARLRYHYKGPKTKAKGRPCQFAGAVNFHQLDFDYFDLSYQDAELRIYSGVVYGAPHMLALTHFVWFIF